MEKITNIESICIFLGITKKTWYNWKKENRPVTTFIEKYLSYQEILEFLDSNEIAHLDFLDRIKNSFYQEYERFTRNTQFEYSFPTKFYLDFIYRFKDDIIKINNYDSKSKFISLLLEYQLILMNIAKEINYSEFNIIKDFNYFIKLFNNRNEVFIDYLITFIKYDSIQTTYFYNQFNLFENEPTTKSTITTYPNKHILDITIDQIKQINKNDSYSESLSFYSEEEKVIFDHQREKDFFEVYEDYLLKKVNDSEDTLSKEDTLILQELENEDDLN